MQHPRIGVGNRHTQQVLGKSIESLFRRKDKHADHGVDELGNFKKTVWVIARDAVGSPKISDGSVVSQFEIQKP